MRPQATRSAEPTLLSRLPRFAVLAAALGILAACAAPDPLEEDLPDMGDFRLAHNIVVADNMQQVPPSRNATPEEWEAILTSEIDRRFGGYEGDRLYHIGIAVDGYALAPPGIPIVLSPRSVLVLSVNVWDDAAGVKLHEEPEQIMVFEGASAETMIVGSGIARNREEQMQILARNAARRIQLWMLQNPEWFNIDPDAAAAAAAEVEELAAAAEPGAEAAEAAAAECIPTDDVPCPEPVAN
ncbi:hypothetical protein N8I71_19640 [Roseibacterium sp. SDUM158016]|jgi:hypothetical protein|uniref:hypothetical protein n=1 Tax=Roseicyclus sediminis TaxID=2980997 RepID=UPI0021CE8834|nr:hypothetical protein [Roseibacterium sp. SDUM158016]MCU4655060.1 hypothetical protein [Roseibacterium sp. SDUM158016]